MRCPAVMNCYCRVELEKKLARELFTLWRIFDVQKYIFYLECIPNLVLNIVLENILYILLSRN